MSKESFHLTIDSTAKAWAKINMENASQEFENYIFARMQNNGVYGDKEVSELKDQIKGCKELIERETQVLTYAMTKIQAIEASENKRRKEVLEEGERDLQSVIDSGLLREL